MPTLKAVFGQKVIAGPLDSYLAHAGWEPQFVDEPNDQSGDILFETLPGDPGAHGEYRERERGADMQMRMRMNPVASTLIALGIGVGVGAAMLVRGASRSADDWSRSEELQTGSATARP